MAFYVLFIYFVKQMSYYETESERIQREIQEEKEWVESFLDPEDLWENDPENPANWGDD